MLPPPSDGVAAWALARMSPSMASAVRLGAKPTLVVLGFRRRARGLAVRLAVELAGERVALPLVPYGVANTLRWSAEKLGWHDAEDNSLLIANWKGRTPWV